MLQCGTSNSMHYTVLFVPCKRNTQLKQATLYFNTTCFWRRLPSLVNKSVRWQISTDAIHRGGIE